MAINTCLTLLVFIEILVPSPENEQSCILYICIRGIDFACFYDFTIGFWNCFYSMVFIVYHFPKSSISSVRPKKNNACFRSTLKFYRQP